jgi:hyperosmotically inducible protein
MIRGLFRLLVLLIVVAVAGSYLLGWWGNGRLDNAGQPRLELETAKEKTAQAAGQARQAIAEGSLTAKIKAKMALDDHVKALDLNVDTVGTVVTLTGIVNTDAERQRALALARDTAGVTQVVDKLQIRR